MIFTACYNGKHEGTRKKGRCEGSLTHLGSSEPFAVCSCECHERARKIEAKPKPCYTVRRVRLNAGGYALPGGYRYFGQGLPLFVAVDKETGDELAHVRATDKDHAVRAFEAFAQEAKRLEISMEAASNLRLRAIDTLLSEASK